MQKAIAFADLTLADGQTIRVAGSSPAVGEQPLLVGPDGTPTGVLPDGAHTTTNGYVLVVQDGQIVAVQLAGAGLPPAALAQPGTPASAETPGLAEEVRRLSAELERQQTQLRHWAGQPAATPATPRPAADAPPAPLHFLRAAARTPGATTADVAEGIRMLRHAKAGHPEYRFNRVNAQRFSQQGGQQGATGKGVNFNDLLARCPDLVPELFHLMVVEEGLAQFFRVMNVNVQGNASLQVELPTLDDEDAGGYLRPGIACHYLPAGASVLNKRPMEVRPWNYYREYCPKEWGNSFRGLAYVNDEELPMESVILELLFAKIRQEWERNLFRGDTAGQAPDAMLGLLTQVLADPDIPTAQITSLAPTASNAVTEFEKLLEAVPAHLYANVQNEPLLWFVPSAHLEAYVRHYRSAYKALPYNTAFEKFGPDSALKRATFVPTTQLAEHHIVTAPGNLFLGVGKDMEVKVEFFDSGQQQYLYVRVEGHTGVGYPLSGQLVLGMPAAAGGGAGN